MVNATNVWFFMYCKVAKGLKIRFNVDWKWDFRLNIRQFLYDHRKKIMIWTTEGYTKLSLSFSASSTTRIFSRWNRMRSKELTEKEPCHIRTMNPLKNLISTYTVSLNYLYIQQLESRKNRFYFQLFLKWPLKLLSNTFIINILFYKQPILK